MPHYKLTYFNIMGGAEHIRLIFAQAGVDFEDNRLTQDEWIAFKPRLNGKDDWEAAKIQELSSGIVDLIGHILPWFREQDLEKKKEFADKVISEHVTPWLERYEKFLTDSGTGYFVGNDVTQIDLGLFQFMGLFAHVMCPERFKKFPELGKFMGKIASLPKVAAWIEKRPKTDH